MLQSERGIMKCPSYEPTSRANKMEKLSAAESRGFHVKASPVKEASPIKPQYPPAEVTTVVFSLNNTTSAVHNKENSSSGEHEGAQEEVLEESGYMSLQNSQIEPHGEEDEHIKCRLPPPAAATQQEKSISPRTSPTKCHGRTNCSRPVFLETPSTPVDCPRRRALAYSLSSTPSSHHDDPNLPILKFQRAVCKELSKSYQKNKRYDWSIVTKVAEDYLLDRVIGGQMGLEFVDVFSSLLSRNMRCILSNILSLLGDMDLISCKKVSKTWRKIICEEAAAQSRCQRAEKTLRESMNSLKQRGCGLTRDVAVSRVVLSCMQTLASSGISSSSSSSSSSMSSSSTPNMRASKRTASCQKGSRPNSQCTRFDEYIQAASGLKQHESLRPCKRCGSPATHKPDIQKATCTRLSCQFVFCTLCQEAFHGSSPCRVVQPRSHFSSSRKTTDIIAGSARSKKNVRRL